VVQRDAARSGCFDTHGRGRLCPDDARFFGRASPVPDLDGAGARTRVPAPARFSGCSHARFQALVSEGAAAEAPCVHMWRVCKLRLRGINRSSWNGGGGSLIVRRSLQIALSATARSSGTSRRAAAAIVGEEKEEEDAAPSTASSNDASHSSAEAWWQRPRRGTCRSQASDMLCIHASFSLPRGGGRSPPPQTTARDLREPRAARDSPLRELWVLYHSSWFY
jgi:hypothetical protein